MLISQSINLSLNSDWMNQNCIERSCNQYCQGSLNRQCSIKQCWIFVISISLMAVFTFDFLAILDLSQCNNQINDYSNQSSCRMLCGQSYYYKINGKCCQGYPSDFKYCLDFNVCKSNKISQLRYLFNQAALKVSILSIVLALLFALLCLLCCFCCKANKRDNSIQHNLLNGNINISEQSGEGLESNKINESFAYQDNQNHCCICLDQFNNEKVILLKCGHIFHSGCIQDWSAKQQNCPICRPSQ